MKQTTKKLFCLVLAAVMVFTLGVTAFAATADNVKQYGTYVCLGDSIAAGFGDYAPKTHCYERVPEAYHSLVADAVGAELIPMAHVGTRTEELLQDMADQTLKSFWAYWQAHAAREPEPKINQENLEIFFAYVQEHQEQARALFREQSTVFWEPILQWISEQLKTISRDQEHVRYTAIFYLSGVVNVANRWLYTGCKESVESLCDLIFSCLPSQ